MTNRERINGALISVNPETGRIDDVFLISDDDQSGAVVAGALARVLTPYHWGWMRALIKRGKVNLKKRG